jgi:putative endonuclease
MCYFITSWGCSSVGLWLVEPTAHRGEHLNKFFVYFIQSRKDGTFYIGQTNNLEKRIERHNRGLVTTTKNRIPFDLVYAEHYNSRREAMLRERYLKSLRGVKEKKTIIERLLI